MIQIKELTEVPPNLEVELAEYSREELARGGDMFKDLIFNASEKAWLLHDKGRLLCVAGVIRESLVSVPHLWFLLGAGFTKNDLRHCRALMKILLSIYPHVEVCVEDSWRRGEKFAIFCGFRRTERYSEILGVRFSFYEGRA